MEKQKTKHPKGLMIFFVANGFFMFGLTMINALLVLYLTHMLNLSIKHAYTIYGAFGALFFSMSLVGGYLGGRYDYKTAIICGGFFAGFGSYLIAIPSLQTIFAGLAAFVIGNGLVVPNLNCLIGKLFSKEDPLRDSGFTITYIGANLGAFVTAASSGFLAKYFGYSTAFILSATMVLLCLLAFVVGFQHIEFHRNDQIKPYQPNISLKNIIPILFTAFLMMPLVMWLLNHAQLNNILLICIGLLVACVILFIALKHQGITRKKLIAFLVFVFFGVAFWSLYMLAPSALTIFIQNNVDRFVLHVNIPTASFYSLNPLFIITLGTIVSLWFLSLSRKGKTISLAKKFAFGITSMGLGYLILVPATYFAAPSGLVAAGWIVCSYFLQTLGELLVGPTGIAMVGRLVPTRHEGFMMGALQLSLGVSGALSAFLAARTANTSARIIHPLVTNPIFQHFFGLYGLITVLIGITMALLIPQFKRLLS